ncbi:hypothetical protein Scep_004305 [Stephania cephalantha]|uniref:Uncharacterized protein n=1 Tax=Stephania cephalantha TaxID=152367 RepID=A0AAP0KS87_9MAGN
MATAAPGVQRRGERQLRHIRSGKIGGDRAKQQQGSGRRRQAAAARWRRRPGTGQLRGAEDGGSTTPVSSCAGEAATARERVGSATMARERGDATQRGETA